MGNYSILKEAEKVANRYGTNKPDGVDITKASWAAAGWETKSLLIRVGDFKKPLWDTYWEAVRQRDWERALLIYQRVVGSPYLLSIDPELSGEDKYLEMEGYFVIRAKEWLTDVEQLLRWE